MNTRIVKNILFICITVFSLSSCYLVSTYYLSSLEPAEITLPPGIRNVSVYPGVITYKSDSGKLDSIDNIRLNPDINYFEFCRGYIDGLVEILEYSPRFDSVVKTDSALIMDITKDEDISWNDIIRICREDSTDAVITLESFYFKDFLDIDNYFGFTCYVEFIIHNSSLWRIYNPKAFNITDYYTCVDTIKWIGLDSHCDNALNKLPQPVDMISESSYWAGKKYGARIAPLWYDNVKRSYYVSGNKNMRRANANVKKEQWQDAIELWRNAANHPNRKVASRACYNLALACEIEDKIDLAFEWIKKSDNLYYNTRTDAYYKILKKRLQNIEKLNKQMLDN